MSNEILQFRERYTSKKDKVFYLAACRQLGLLGKRLYKITYSTPLKESLKKLARHIEHYDI